MMNKKLLIIIPYRNRLNHLNAIIPHLNQTLYNQNIIFDIVVIEQNDKNLFNRGLLCNIGFIENYIEYDYICFHDVDMISSDIDYSYSENPTCLLRHRSKFQNVYKEYFGGITIFPVHIFQYINGFSNNYWGWGAEDDDLRLRCLKLNIKTSYRNGSCIDLELVTDEDNRKLNPNYQTNLNRFIKFKNSSDLSDIFTDGLSNINDYYKIIDSNLNTDYTKIIITTINHNE